MPLPKPRKGEHETEWIQRCMGNPVMDREYPDTDQRVAICHQIWDDKNKSDYETLESIWDKY